MKIVINQKSIAFGSQYRIFVNQSEMYFAETDAFSRNIIHLYEKDSGLEVHTIFKSLSFFKPKYKIEMPDGRRIKFWSRTFWGTYFSCLDNEALYEIYSHPESKTSIYKNNVQIGFGAQEIITILSGDHYELTLNNDADFKLLICFFLILDHLNTANGNLLTFNVDLVFNKFKEFDPAWKPV